MISLRKLIGHLRSFACAFALALTVGWHANAAADETLDTLVWIVQQMESAGVSPLPVTSGEIKAAAGLFDCIKKDSSAKGVASCLYTFSQSEQGKQMLGSHADIELPPWLENLVAAYVDIREKDYWGLVADLGEAAMCIAAQALAMGIDICGLVKDLIALGEALLDAGKAVVQFFASVGEGAWETAKAIGCELGLGGCSSGPPEEVVAYECVFAPAVKPAGLHAREAVDPYAYNALRAKLVKTAVEGTVCNLFPRKFGSGAAEKAAKAFDNAVDGVWTADILSNVLAQRDKKRLEYSTQQQVFAVAAAAASAYDQNKAAGAKAQPASWIQNWIVHRCAVDDFGAKFGFAHVDRWLEWRKAGQTEAQKNALKVPNVTSNASWCTVDFLNKHRDQFAVSFADFAKGKYCPAFGATLACGSLAAYEACTGLLSSVGKSELCGANAAGIGKELAAQIDAYFKSKNSQFPCQTVLPDGGAPAINKPVQYVCSRPAQQYYCNQKYRELWTAKTEVLSCTKQPSTAYVALMNQVAKEVAALKGKHPSVGIDTIDPLLLHAGAPQVFAALKKDADANGGKLGTGTVAFEFLAATPHPIDGVLKPTITGDFKAEVAIPPVAANTIGGAVQLIKPGDPDPALKPSMAAPVAAGAVAAGALKGAAPASQPSTLTSGPAPTSPPARGAQPPSDAASVRTPVGSALPAVQSQPATSQLPAIQAPTPGARATPNWSALGNAPPAAGTGAAPPAADIARQLQAASCSAAPGGLRFSCTTRAGFDRCEALRRERKVEHCALAAGR